MKSLVWDWQLHLSNVKSRVFSHFSHWSLKDHCGSEPQENTGTRSERMFQLRFPKLHVHVAAFENQLLLIVISILQLSFLIPKNPPARIVAFAYIILHVVAFFIVPRMAEDLFTAGISTEKISGCPGKGDGSDLDTASICLLFPLKRPIVWLLRYLDAETQREITPPLVMFTAIAWGGAKRQPRKLIRKQTAQV